MSENELESRSKESIMERVDRLHSELRNALTALDVSCSAEFSADEAKAANLAVMLAAGRLATTVLTPVCMTVYDMAGREAASEILNAISRDVLATVEAARQSDPLHQLLDTLCAMMASTNEQQAAEATKH